MSPTAPRALRLATLVAGDDHRPALLRLCAGEPVDLPSIDLIEFVKLQETFANSPKSWSVDAKNIDKKTFDLSVKNPNGGEEIVHRSPAEILDEIAALDTEGAEVLRNIKALL